MFLTLSASSPKKDQYSDEEGRYMYQSDLVQSSHQLSFDQGTALQGGGQKYFRKVCELLSIRSGNYLGTSIKPADVVGPELGPLGIWS